MPRLVAAALLAALTVSLSFGPRPAHADEHHYAHGFYAEMGLGATGFLGNAQAYADTGPMFAIRSGYDLTSWFSIGGLVCGSTHQASVPPPPVHEYFQLYQGGADARLTLRINRFALFAEGSLGGTMISTNVLDRVMVTQPDTHFTLMFVGGGGLDYHTQNRHYSLGLAGDWSLLPSFASSQAVTVRAYLRYAY